MPPNTSPNTSPNIPTGYLKLGHKAFYLLTLKRSAVAICFLILEIALLAVNASGVVRSSVTAQTVGLLNGAVIIIFIIFIVALLAALLSGYISYIAFRYRVDENGFLTERGITSRQETSLPFRQIQNVDIEQSILYRMFGVCDLIILTAGHEDKEDAGKNESEIILPAIDIAIARNLRAYLLERANVQEVIPERVIAEKSPAN